MARRELSDATSLSRMKGAAFSGIQGAFKGRSSSPSEDDQRREFILTLLLAGSLVLAATGLLASIAFQLIAGHDQYSNSILSPAIFILVLLALWRLKAVGHYLIAAYILMGLFFIVAAYLMIQWSFELPQAELLIAAVIVMTGIMIGARAGLLAATAATILVAALAITAHTHWVHPNTQWLSQEPQAADWVAYAACYWIIALVSWLANREIEKSLTRAHQSENALRQQRDNLEVAVKQRTAELEQAQHERERELQQFAAFGRFSAGLVHDLANPLTAASLNLEQLNQEAQSELAKQAMRSVHYLERYVEAARKQLMHKSSIKRFSVSEELSQIVQILTYKAHKAAVKIELDCPEDCHLAGDPVKFNQIAANIIANAIDSYPEAEEAESSRAYHSAPIMLKMRRVLVRAEDNKEVLKLVI